MAAAAAATPVGKGGAAATTSRFAAACGALSQYVKQAAEAERMQMHARPAAVPVRPLALMPGADVSSDACSPDGGLDHLAHQAAPAPAQMMTIMYGGRVLVLDDVPADKAAGLLRLAAGSGAAAAQEDAGTEVTCANHGGQVSVSAAAADLLPVARKASLQRFMEKRKVRVAAARAEPYRRPDVVSDAYCPDLKLAL